MTSGRSRSRSPAHDRSAGAALKEKRRQYRKKREDSAPRPQQGNDAPQNLSIRAQQLLELEEQVLAAVGPAVEERVAQLANSDEVQKRIMVRLKEERSKLEAAVTRQLEEEHAVMLQRKRREQDEAKRQQEELERILEENRRKVEEAQMRAARGFT